MGEQTDLSAPLLASEMARVQPVEGGQPTFASAPKTDESVVEAVFVARFDVKEGNMIEWAHPVTAQQLEGVEFKVLMSGAHSVTEDWVLFQYHGLYGVAYYNQRKDATAPRGAWQRSVGVLVRHHYFLKDHLAFLASAAPEANTDSAACYARLKQHYEVKNCCGPSDGPAELRKALVPPPVHPGHFSPKQAANYLREVALACGSIEDVVDFYGKGVFRVWRALMCRLRVILLDAPPAKSVCGRLHAASGLLQVEESHHADVELPYRMYYVTVSDIPMLQEISRTYIACTTERILRDKTKLYDLMLDGKEFVFPDARHAAALQPHASDAALFARLCTARKDATNKAEACLDFFEQLNTSLVCLSFCACVFVCVVGGCAGETCHNPPPPLQTATPTSSSLRRSGVGSRLPRSVPTSAATRLFSTPRAPRSSSNALGWTLRCLPPCVPASESGG